jgi:hypothetical protein
MWSEFINETYGRTDIASLHIEELERDSPVTGLGGVSSYCVETKPVVSIVITLYNFLFPFYLQSVLVHSATCVKDVYSGM